MTWVGYLALFIVAYVVPFIFAIGLIFLIYGVIQYFILGPGEEPVREEGREHFIKAFVWFLGGALLYALVAGTTALVLWVGQFQVEGGTQPGLQNVPNTPQRNI